MGKQAVGVEVSRRVLFLLAAVLLSSGCATTDWRRSVGVPPPAVCRVAAIWQNTVFYANDPAHNGKSSPGIAGRVYLFGPDLKETLIGDGALVAEAYADASEDAPLLERWEIDPATLRRLVKEDGMMGKGYTVYLPWTKRSPDLTTMSKVLVRLKYQPPTGMAVFAENVVSLAAGNGQVTVTKGGPPMELPRAPAWR